MKTLNTIIKTSLQKMSLLTFATILICSCQSSSELITNQTSHSDDKNTITISGTIAGNPSNLINTVWQTNDKDVEDIKSSCQSSESDELNLIAVNQNNEISKAPFSDLTGLQLNPSDHYRLFIGKNEETCLALHNDFSTTLGGQVFLLETQEEEIDLGEILLEKSRILTTNSSLHYNSDFDNDGIPNAHDPDSNNDGEVDYDSDLNGIPDWYENKTLPEDINPKCGITMTSPYQGSTAVLDTEGFHRFHLYVSTEIDDINLKKIYVIDEINHTIPGLRLIKSYKIKHSTLGPVIRLVFQHLTEGQEYTLVLEPGFIQCENGYSEKRLHEIQFTAGENTNSFED